MKGNLLDIFLDAKYCLHNNGTFSKRDKCVYSYSAVLIIKWSFLKKT